MHIQCDYIIMLALQAFRKNGSKSTLPGSPLDLLFPDSTGEPRRRSDLPPRSHNPYLLSTPVSRFLRDPGGEPVVEPVHQHPAPWQAHVRPVRGPPGERRAGPPVEANHDALRQSVGPAHPALGQHGRVQTVPHYGPRGGGWWVGTRVGFVMSPQSTKNLCDFCSELRMILHNCPNLNEQTWNKQLLFMPKQ